MHHLIESITSVEYQVIARFPVFSCTLNLISVKPIERKTTEPNGCEHISVKEKAPVNEASKTFKFRYLRVSALCSFQVVSTRSASSFTQELGENNGSSKKQRESIFHTMVLVAF
ncbi:hypothetical protein JTB14_008342 [Gonioctena quinquepunctata]|nr:hypothetical protein JTB14_008342 [Gonioctena quinquepunctata]